MAMPTAESKPMTLRPFIQEEHRETFIEIYEANPGQRLVTSIEVLSPSNKRPGTEGWDLYQRKRQSLLLGDVSLVEFDLLRGGQRMPMLDPWPDSPYTPLAALRESPTLPSLAGRLSSTVAAHSRAPHEARSRYPSGPSAADRRDLSAFSVRAKHRLQQATQPAARLRRSPLAGDAAKENVVASDERMANPARNSPRPRFRARKKLAASPFRLTDPTGRPRDLRGTARIGGRTGRGPTSGWSAPGAGSPGAGGRCRPAPDRPARRDGPARPDGNGRRTRAIRRAGRRCPGRAGSSVRPSARVLGSVGAAVSGSLGAPRRFRRVGAPAARAAETTGGAQPTSWPRPP